MSLSKEVVIDKIEVVENGIIQVRQVTRIMEDGQQLSSSYHRWSLTPGQDVTDQPANVQAIAAAAWTEEVVAAYQAAQEAAAATRPTE
jgi:hypothetical protein